MTLSLSKHCFKAMGGPCEISLYLNPEQKSFLTILETEVRRLETKYSRYLKNSIIQKINQHNAINVDDETAGLLNYAENCYQISDGLFDITSGVLRQAWDFKNNIIPHQKILEKTLKKVGWHKLNWNGKSIKLAKGMEIDFGGIAKEYAVDVLARRCEKNNIQHGLINLSGDIRVLGAHPNGDYWHIGIQHPRIKDEAIASIPITQGALASSGDYERYFIKNKKRYCHILNPITGYPIEHMASVSIQADECLVAGSLSTIAMLKGLDSAKKWLDTLGCEYLLIDNNMETYFS